MCGVHVGACMRKDGYFSYDITFFNNLFGPFLPLLDSLGSKVTDRKYPG